ncbi:hypothetical protein B0T18DRAFT_479243 [Schizothecium vesticola]|uniref:Tyrosinase copper-binding domain-containing protein n=1 Tax=Schizothecium vesticola TaxID=314040 RepID=A0AA40K7X1_9PEZI|nr:hypothetical protein B0T18DRAFT_479243 [Schizothecium vesticola]
MAPNPRLGYLLCLLCRDNFTYTYAVLYNQIHDFAAFLPWHRYYVMVYEKALRDYGYTGVAMYWNWYPVTGFDGNGVDTGDNGIRKRVIDGPFKDWRPAYWHNSFQPHWLSRDWSPPQFGEPELRGARYSPAEMATVNNNTVFDDFRRTLENGPHAAVHGGVGGAGDNRGLGDMGLNNASPSDPLFFLHHTQVDRLWWLWQQKNPSVRIMEYNGNFPTPDGSPGPALSLNDKLPMGGLAADGAKLCYKY